MDIFLYSNKGGKSHNEDNAFYCEKNGKWLFIVADGLGGIRKGEMASELIVKTIAELWNSTENNDENCESTIDLLEELILKANEKLVSEQENQGVKMKSTAVVLEVFSDKAVWTHIGDSRLYFISNNDIGHITHDHSVAYKKYEAKEISFEDINHDEDQSSLLRCVGDLKRCTPETEYIEGLCEGDAFLLCTDGAWSNLYKEEILIDYLKSRSSEEWTRLLLMRILERMPSDNDNITILAVRV